MSICSLRGRVRSRICRAPSLSRQAERPVIVGLDTIDAPVLHGRSLTNTVSVLRRWHHLHLGGYGVLGGECSAVDGMLCGGGKVRCRRDPISQSSGFQSAVTAPTHSHRRGRLVMSG
jgi:hypothetical protein